MSVQLPEEPDMAAFLHNDPHATWEAWLSVVRDQLRRLPKRKGKPDADVRIIKGRSRLLQTLKESHAQQRFLETQARILRERELVLTAHERLSHFFPAHETVVHATLKRSGGEQFHLPAKRPRHQESQEVDDPTVSPFRNVVMSYQGANRFQSLPHHCILVTGVPMKVASTTGVFKNHVKKASPTAVTLTESVASMVHILRSLSRQDQDTLTELIGRHFMCRGVNGVVEMARDFLPANLDTRTEEFAALVKIVHEVFRRRPSFEKLLIQGSERTMDMWVWRDFYDELFDMESGVIIY
ncbi:hypothetical protein HDU85_007820 [Gaertneriomyces sp. JEL0708]|nr:hypothetical protein HDU85_007820 [Gaertneriomyces sp. JEL0708]